MSESDLPLVTVEIDRNGARSVHYARLLVIQATRQCWAVLAEDDLQADSKFAHKYQLDPMLLAEQPDSLDEKPMYQYAQVLRS
jgi:hypothetical protein